MKKLLSLTFCGAALQAQTVVTNFIYVTNFVYVTNTVVYVPPTPVVMQPTVIYETVPMIVSPVYVSGPYIYRQSPPPRYYGPVRPVGVGSVVGVGVKAGHH